MKNLFVKLAKVQDELFVPKGQRNDYGKYNYRSCEDILVKVKPLLSAEQMVLMLLDHVEMVGQKTFVKAEAKLIDLEDGEEFSAYGWAEIANNQSGMTPAQITGSTSSYARKYALNGLFAIDNTKDDDTNEHYERTHQPDKPQAQPQPRKIESDADGVIVAQMMAKVNAMKTKKEVKEFMQNNKAEEWFSAVRPQALKVYNNLAA